MKLRLRKYFQLKSRILSRKAKIITLLLVMILLAASILIVNQEVIHHRVYQAVGKTLSEWVSKETGGLYKLSYDSMKVNTFKRQLTLRNVMLEIDSSRIDQLENIPKNIYEAKTPELFLDIRSIWKFITEDKLEFVGIKIRKPEVYIYNTHIRDSTSNISTQSGDIYLKINKYLDEFNIKDFTLTDGKFKYKNIHAGNEIVVDDINAYVNNLAINTAEKTTDTDRVRVVLKNPAYFLADSLHKVEMDSLLVDSENKNIILSKVVIYPDYQQLQQINHEEVNLYNFVIPSIELTGIDFAAAYNDNILDIESIFIPEPEITIDTHKEGTVNVEKNNNLVKQLSYLFNTIRTSEFILKDGELDLALEAEGKIRNITVDNTTIQIRDLDLDTLKYSQQNSHINFRSFNLELKDYHLILADSIHEMTMETLTYSSDSSMLIVKDLDIFPTDKNLNSVNVINAHTPLINLKGFDAKKYLQEHDLSLEEIEINDPVISYHNFVEGDSAKQPKFNFIFLENKIAEAVSSDRISIKNFNFQLHKSSELITEFNEGEILLEDFDISNKYPEDSTLFFNSRNVLFNFPEFTFLTKKQDQIFLENISGNLSKSEFRIKNLYLTPSNKSFTLLGENALVQGIHIRDAIYGENINIDTLLVEYIDIKKVPAQTKVSQHKKSLQMPVKVNFLKVLKGNLEIQNEQGLTTRISNIAGYANKMSFTETEFIIKNGKATTGEIILTSAKDNLIVGASGSEITKNDLILSLPYIKPVKQGIDNVISLNASRAELHNLNINSLVNDQKFHASQLKMLSTELVLNKSTSKKTGKVKININWNEALKNSLSEILIDKITFSGSALKFGINQGKLTTGDYEIELDQFDTNLDGQKHLLNSKNIRIKSNDIAFTNKNNSIEVGQFTIDQNQKLITVYDFLFINDETELSLPVVFGKEVDLRKLAEENQIIGRELEVAGFKFTLKNKGNRSEEDQNLEMPQINFKEVNAHQGFIKINTAKLGKYVINNVRWNLQNFDTEKHKDELFYSSDFNMKGGTLTGLTKNKLNKVIISGIEINDNGSDLRFNYLYYKPEFSKKKYAYQLGHETDWIDLIMEDISITGINLKNYLQTNEYLEIDNIEAAKLNAHVYRDKKLPFPEDQQPPMPQEMLRNLELPIFINTVHIASANVTYQELGEISFEPGELVFSDMDIKVLNITNMHSRLNSDQNMLLHVNGEIERTPLVATATFDLLSPENKFTFSGNIGESELAIFNKILEHNVFIKIERGNSKGITFHYKANDDYALGSMNFYYKNLKVSIIDKKTNKTSGFDESIASFFANTFIINSNNPQLFTLKEGDIYFERDKSKSILNYWAKSFLSGIVSSIGAKNHKKEVKEALSKENE